jgi:4-methyl-5(b-hydroxyethyl)-thiazole monophosphate biosynthesis
VDRVRRVLLLLSDGVEILEAAAFHDVLGWASEYGRERLEVVTVGSREEIRCTFGLRVAPDMLLEDVRADEFDALAVPGGFVEYGFDASAMAEPVATLIRDFDTLGKPIATICTGAIPVAASGVLRGRRATTYHLMGGARRRQLAELGAEVVDRTLVRDGHITTSSGPATAVEVALVLLEQLTDRNNAGEIRRLMGYDSSGLEHGSVLEEGS